MSTDRLYFYCSPAMFMDIFVTFFVVTKKSKQKAD